MPFPTSEREAKAMDWAFSRYRFVQHSIHKMFITWGATSMKWELTRSWDGLNDEEKKSFMKEYWKYLLGAHDAAN